MDNWIIDPLPTLLVVVFSVLLIFTIILIFTRLSGLRTFAKMSSIDFASTIAIGSILASVVMNTGQSVIKGTVALGAVIAFQSIFSHLKRKSNKFTELLTNSPVLLMDGKNILHHNLVKTNVSEEDLMAKLREANVRNFDEVLAVVFESTGDVSVLHANDGAVLDRERILKGVKK